MIASAMGWVGTVGTMVAYVLLSKGRWSSASLRYASLNAVGGLLGGTASAVYGAWPSVGSNALWSVVAVHSIVVTLHARRGTRVGVLRFLPARPAVVATAVLAPVAEATALQLDTAA